MMLVAPMAGDDEMDNTARKLERHDSLHLDVPAVDVRASIRPICNVLCSKTRPRQQGFPNNKHPKEKAFSTQKKNIIKTPKRKNTGKK